MTNKQNHFYLLSEEVEEEVEEEVMTKGAETEGAETKRAETEGAETKGATKGAAKRAKTAAKAATKGATEGATKGAAKGSTKGAAKGAKTAAKAATEGATKAEELAPLRLQLSETFSYLREKEHFLRKAREYKVRARNVVPSLDIIVNHLELKRGMDQLISEIEKVGKVPYQAPCEKCNRKGRKNKMFIQRLPSGSVAAVCRYCKYSTAHFPDESLKRGLLDDF